MGLSRSPEAQERHHARMGERELARIMRGPDKRLKVERSLNARQVADTLNIGNTTLWGRARAGLIPPPLKGVTCPPGRDPESWQRQDRKWPASLIYGLAAGLIKGPLAPDEWQALMRDHHDSR